MSEDKLSPKELSKLLSTAISDQPKDDSIGLVAIVRASKQRDSIDLALDNTGRWVTLPLASIESAKDLDTAMYAGSLHRIVEMVIARPKTDSAFFDLLAFALEQAGTLLSKKSCGCSHGGGLPSPIFMAHRRSQTTVANCIACWIMTMTVVPEFCYKFGHCDN